MSKQDDKKSPKETSALFHNIMKASVTHNNSDVEKCPICGETGKKMGHEKRDRILVIKFVCPNGHPFENGVEMAWFLF